VSVEEESWSFFEIKSVTCYSFEKRNQGSLHQSLANGHWQADLINFQKYNERGLKWILTVVDVFSKYLWARPLKKKSAEEVKEAFSHIFKERRPIALQTDNSKEFKNTIIYIYGV